MDDPRGDLARVFVRLCERVRPRWIVWENVPGVLSSSGGRDFSAFTGALAQLGYGFAYRILDAQFFGVPQRRRRVFLVGHFGDWRRAAAVLFEQESVRRDSQARGKAGKDPSRSIEEGARKSCERLGIEKAWGGGGIANTLTTRNRFDPSTETLIPGGFFSASTQYGEKAGALTASHDSSPCADRGQNIVVFDQTQITSKANRSKCEPGSPCHTLSAQGSPPSIAFANKDIFQVQWASGGGKIENNTAQAIRAGAEHNYQFVRKGSDVRRLTPTECERLQGFPDGYTAIQFKGKPAKDSPRYRALGNSMAVPVMRWIGQRILEVEGLPKPL